MQFKPLVINGLEAFYFKHLVFFMDLGFFFFSLIYKEFSDGHSRSIRLFSIFERLDFFFVLGINF